MDKPFTPGTRVRVIEPARGSNFGGLRFFYVGDTGTVISHSTQERDYFVQFDEASFADTANHRRWYVGDDSLQLENPNA